MAKFDWLPAGVNRKRRIIGRFINAKALPAHTYRFDERAPAAIRATGFQPWNGAGGISAVEHVTNAYGVGHAQAGQATKADSQWVSTASYGMLKQLDPVMAQKIPGGINLYRINTAIALGTGNFVDANDHFDRERLNRPYATQREWIKLGGIDQAAVTDYMDGLTYFNQLDAQDLAPDENALAGWLVF